MKFLALLFLILVFCCSSNEDISSDKPLDIVKLPGIEVYNNALELRESNDELRTYILNNINTLDSTDWKSMITKTLLIDLVESNCDTSELAHGLRSKTIFKFYKSINKTKAKDKLSHIEIIQHYLSAYNFSQYSRYYESKLDTNSHLWYAKSAAYYSPLKQQVENCKEIINLLKGKSEFRTEYTNALENYGKSKEIWKFWFDHAILYDDYLPELEKWHSQLYKEDNFTTFWNDKRFSKFPVVTDFMYTNTEDDTLKFIDKLGNWLMLDFWSYG